MTLIEHRDHEEQAKAMKENTTVIKQASEGSKRYNRLMFITNVGALLVGWLAGLLTAAKIG